MREEIRALQQDLGLTVVYVTHDQQEALAVSDRIVVMADAVIAQEGAPRELYEQPANLFVAYFIGDANIVTGRLRRIDGATGVVAVAGTEIELPHRGAPAGDVHLAIRPEAVRLTSAAPTDPHVAGTVVKAAYLGGHMEYTVATPMGDLFVVDRSIATPLRTGASVCVTLARDGVAVVRD